MDEQKAMQEFSDWFAQSGWTTSIARGASWEAWQASRAGVVVDLSMLGHQHDEGPLYYRVDDVHAAIEAAGVKVAP